MRTSAIATNAIQERSFLQGRVNVQGAQTMWVLSVEVRTNTISGRSGPPLSADVIVNNDTFGKTTYDISKFLYGVYDKGILGSYAICFYVSY